MGGNTSRAMQDYLKAIYELTREERQASTNAIAEWMEVTPASATVMIQKLASMEPPLVTYRKHHGVILTPQGEQVALEVIRHHRLLELFLQEKLGYTWDEVHHEADRLEHVISEIMEDRIAQSLGDPIYDPHGEPIPNRDHQMPCQSATRLIELRPGDQAIVQRVGDTDPGLLRYLGSIGVTPQRQVVIMDYSVFDDNLRLQVKGQNESIVLGPRITREIYVEKV